MKLPAETALLDVRKGRMSGMIFSPMKYWSVITRMGTTFILWFLGAVQGMMS